MVHASPHSPCSTAVYQPSPLRPRTVPSPIAITSPSNTPSSSPHASSLPRGSYSRSIALSASPGICLTYGAGPGKDSSSARRRSSSGVPGGPVGAASTARSLGGNHGAFAGSYEASLLSFRFSTPASPPIPFRLKLSAASSSGTLSHKSTPPLCLPFDAHFFPLSSADNIDFANVPHALAPPLESTPSTPYVASIDLTPHYSSLPFPALLPSFPGHPIPVKGQIQAVISNSAGTGVKVFVIPFDLEGMQAGQRMVLRQNTFEEETSGGSKRLRASASLHVCCVQARSTKPTAAFSHSLPSTNLNDSTLPLKFYLHSTIRLVFSPLPAGAPGDGPPAARCSSVIDLGSPAQGLDRFMSWDDEAAEEYQTLRHIRRVAIKRRDAAQSDTRPSARSPGPASYPLPRPAESYALPPLPRDRNYDLLASPSIQSVSLPPSRREPHPPASAFDFAKVRGPSGRSSPAPTEESELSRRLRNVRVDHPGR